MNKFFISIFVICFCFLQACKTSTEVPQEAAVEAAVTSDVTVSSDVVVADVASVVDATPVVDVSTSVDATLEAAVVVEASVVVDAASEARVDASRSDVVSER